MTAALVFAYGSNLDEKQMATRCPGARPACVARLAHHRLAFAGFSFARRGSVATVLPARERSVVGLVYQLDRDDLWSLDGHEGHPWYYRRRLVQVRPIGVGWSSGTLSVQTYVLDARREGLGWPSVDYLTQIALAYRRLGFPAKELSAAIELCPPRKVVPRTHVVARPKPTQTALSFDRKITGASRPTKGKQVQSWTH